jgi:hypothetical protein
MSVLATGFIVLGIIFLLMAVIISWPINDATNWAYYYFLRKVQKSFLYASAFCFVAWSLIKAFSLTAVNW